MSTATFPDLPLLAEGEGWIAIDKPAGLLVHPSQLDAHEADTVLARAQAQFGRRFSPAHRLDKGTSGVLLLTHSAPAAALLGAWFRDEQIHKRYLGLVRGWPQGEQGVIDHPLARDPEQPSAGQAHLPAQTRWQVLQRLSWPVRTQPGFEHTRGALLELEPLQGRRHQIRRHCKHIAHPLIGDATHGKGPLNRALAAHLGRQRLWLHAQRLELPDSQVIEAPPGPEWSALQQA
ncbi:tRNA pseudouridine65 synthase [Inhella inkyongensis]|uniref:tRNA pseudouridine65 synthase n=1 Tax=Inhella inkyongensis TaxID=392593 RepID=A0A840S703_9BURK|nr:pseudouridine synthase [Inhella inkyongensis]MBB5204240.1 tRNA pseudouridine65 synthase [Inhella inkyongensis]